MWPLLLDMTKEESIQNLRNLELEAYAHLVSALRAQGPLSSDKRRLLKETSIALNITQERHKAEVRRAISDEKLNTIAYHITGHTETLDDWAQEGRRLVPLLPRTAPQTAFSALADETAEAASQSNKQLPSPSSTERKRQTITQMVPTAISESTKTIPFRIPDPPKLEETKKRKLPICPENSSLAQHLLAPKLCRIQQLYRQRCKPKTKEIHKKADPDQLELIQQHRIMQQVPQPVQQQSTLCPTPQTPIITQKVNVLQNISLQPIKDEIMDQDEASVNVCPKPPDQQHVPVCSNENQAPPRPKLITNIKPNTNITLKQVSSQPPGPSNEVQKSIKMCSSKKPVTKTVNSGQKLIVVSNAQTIQSNSILQRTLQIPFVKNVSIKNFEKFKIVTSNSTPTSIQVTNVTNSGVNSVKHKVVTVKTNPTTKKVIPFSQLQVLNSKGSIKVLPLGGKIVGKSVATTSSPLYIMNAMGATQSFTKSTSSSPIITTSKIQPSVVEEVKPPVSEGGNDVLEKTCQRSPNRENGKSSVLEDILKASGVISEECVAEDYDTKIEEFHIPQNKSRDLECDNGESKIKMEEIVKSEEVQNCNYEVLPFVDCKENLEMTEIKPEICEEDVVSTELIESESMSCSLQSQVEESRDISADHEDSIDENLSQVVPQVECPTTSDINEPN